MSILRRPGVRYSATFVLGLLVGGLIVDLFAVRAIQAQVINVRSRFYAEHSFLAARARCQEDWLAMAFHAWNAANATSEPGWRSLRIHESDRSLAMPFFGWVFLGMEEHLIKSGGYRVVSGVDRADFARALEKLGRPEAQAEWQRAASMLKSDVEHLRAQDPKGDLCRDPKYAKDLDRILRDL